MKRKAKEKKVTEKRLLDELKFKAKLARLSNGKHEYALYGGLPNEKVLKGVEETQNLDSANWLILSDEVERMVAKTHEDEDGFLYIRINLKTPRAVIHWGIDSILDGHIPRRISDFLFEAGRKGLTYEETTRILKKEYDYPKPKQRFRAEQTKVLEIWEAWSLAKTKPLSLIAKEFELPYSTARSRWIRAYLLIHGEKYIPRKVRTENKEKALSTLCSKCKTAKCYKSGENQMEQIPCAEYIALAGRGYQREKTLSKKQDDLINSGELAD